jgi:hypothetical protein
MRIAVLIQIIPGPRQFSPHSKRLTRFAGVPPLSRGLLQGYSDEALVSLARDQKQERLPLRLPLVFARFRAAHPSGGAGKQPSVGGQQPPDRG